MEQKVIEFEKVQDTFTMEKKEKSSVATISETNGVMENPVGYLNDKFQLPNRPQYRVLFGPPENPNFSIELSLKGRNFFGEGKSKKEAKKASAQKAVDELIFKTNQSRMEQKVIEFEKVQDTFTMEKKRKIFSSYNF